jgi:hypothetical protein
MGPWPVKEFGVMKWCESVCTSTALEPCPKSWSCGLGVHHFDHALLFYMIKLMCAPSPTGIGSRAQTCHATGGIDQS